MILLQNRRLLERIFGPGNVLLCFVEGRSYWNEAAESQLQLKITGSTLSRIDKVRTLVPAANFGNVPNTVSGSMASNTELSELFGAH